MGLIKNVQYVRVHNEKKQGANCEVKRKEGIVLHLL
jgi:hypothetical protein